MHLPPLRLDCSDPNSAERCSKVVDTGLQEIEVETVEKTAKFLAVTTHSSSATAISW